MGWMPMSFSELRGINMSVGGTQLSWWSRSVIGDKEISNEQSKIMSEDSCSYISCALGMMTEDIAFGLGLDESVHFSSFIFLIMQN